MAAALIATSQGSIFIQNASYSVSICVALALILLVIHAVLDVGIQRCSASVRALAPAARHDLVIQFVWLLTCTPIPVLYAAALPELWSSGIEGRWLRTSATCEYAMLLHVASSLYEAVIFFVYKKPIVYMIHHAIVVYAYGMGLWMGAMHFWGAWDGLTEVSNINLCFLKIGLILERGRGSTAETVNGLLLYFLFLVVRVLSLPLWLALYAHDLYVAPESTWHHPDAGPMRKMCMLTYPLCTLAIWGLSVSWFQPIHKGMLKALREKGALAPVPAIDKAVAILKAMDHPKQSGEVKLKRTKHSGESKRT
jgi:hypothetical protein